MTIQNVSQLPLDVCCVKCRSATLWAAAGAFLKKMAAVAFLSGVLWSPPSLGQEWIYDEAQWGSPDAPFLLSDDTLYIGGSFDSAREVELGDRVAAIHVADGTRLHLSGLVSSFDGSTAGLEKVGTGALALSGANTFRGNTMLREGTLHIVGDNALGRRSNALLAHQGSVVSYAPGTTLFNQIHLWGSNSAADDGSSDPVSWALADSVQWRVDTGVAVQAGNMVGSIPVVKQGPGTLRFTGIASFPSFVTVKEGTLDVDWHLAGTVRVNKGARLEGGGTVRKAIIEAGGVLSPGSGAGHTAAFTVTEQLEFQPGATLEVDAMATGQADSVLVAGTALLDGHVMTRAGQGDWQPTTSYSLLQATEGFAGTRFASVATDLAFLTPTLSYGENAVYLRLDRNGTPLEEGGETPTEEEVGEVIDENEIDPQGPGQPVTGPPQKDNQELHDHIIGMDQPQASAAFNQLSGNWTASVRSGLLEDSRFVREAVLQNAGKAPSWSHAFYSLAARASEGGTPADERDIAGLVMGMERPIGANVKLGGFFGAQHSHSWRRQAMADAKVQSMHVGLDLAVRLQHMDVTLGMARTWHKINSHRKIGMAGLHDALSGNYGARTLQWFGEVVAPIRWFAKVLAAPSLSMSPFARLAWVQARSDGFVESGGAAAARVLPARQSLLFSTLGLRAVHNVETPSGSARLQGQLAWHHAGGDVRAFSRQSFRDSARQTVFASEGLPVARRAWSLDLSMQADLTKAVSLGVAYSGRYAPGRRDHGARANLRWVF